MSDKAQSAIAAFIKAQSEMGKALKDSTNPHFKQNYADLKSVQTACFPALNANGFAVMQPLGLDENGEFVDTQFLHEGGEKFSTKVYLRVGKNDMQAYGSAQTYARRYGLMALAGIAPEDDDGKAAADRPPEDKPAFDASAAAERIHSAIAKRKTKQGLKSLWHNEVDALAAIKGVSLDIFTRVETAFKEAATKAHDDPALQAPPVDPFQEDEA